MGNREGVGGGGVNSTFPTVGYPVHFLDCSQRELITLLIYYPDVWLRSINVIQFRLISFSSLHISFSILLTQLNLYPRNVECLQVLSVRYQVRISEPGGRRLGFCYCLDTFLDISGLQTCYRFEWLKTEFYVFHVLNISLADPPRRCRISCASWLAFAPAKWRLLFPTSNSDGLKSPYRWRFRVRLVTTLEDHSKSSGVCRWYDTEDRIVRQTE